MLIHQQPSGQALLSQRSQGIAAQQSPHGIRPGQPIHRDVAQHQPGPAHPPRRGTASGRASPSTETRHGISPGQPIHRDVAQTSTRLLTAQPAL